MVECANLTVQRFRFRNEKLAEQAWLGFEAKLPKLMELRGKQVLVLSGKRVPYPRSSAVRYLSGILKGLSGSSSL